MRAIAVLVIAGWTAMGCDSGAGVDAGVDASHGVDASRSDASGVDAADASGADASREGADAGEGADAFVARDAGQDAFLTVDAGHDAFASIDAGHDAFVASGGCISGAVGTHALRFRWRGSSPGSTAYVDYELNQLPDTSRWHVTSASSSFSYTPTFDDTFLAEGGLDLEDTAFIDVELSTAGLASVSRATIAIYGRSFDTTASGSFSWQSFHDMDASPTDLVANSAPYAWYLADATSALPAGDDAMLLRIRPGPSSDALIVSRVEICFED